MGVTVQSEFLRENSASVPMGTSGYRLLMLLCCVFLSACSASSSEPATDAANVGLPPDEVLSRLWSEHLVDATQDALGPIRFPEDLAPHPYRGAESFLLRSILSRADGTMISIQAQLDRLALNIEPSAGSDWGFSEIMRSSMAFAMTGQAALAVRETLERRALGLADSRPETIFVTEMQLEYHPGPGGENPAELCQGRYEFATVLPEYSEESGPSVTADRSRLSEVLGRNSAVHLQLSMEMEVCPERLSLQTLNRWQGAGLKSVASLSGRVASTSKRDDAVWQGHGWLAQSWGSLPSPGGAVLIDQAQLELRTGNGADLLSLSASRSKRKSGRGPQTVQGTLQATGESGQQVLELEWLDEGEQVSPVSGTSYPQRFRLRTRDKAMDLLLTPLVGLSELSDSLGSRWAGAVMVSGTHSGMGFVDFQPQ